MNDSSRLPTEPYTHAPSVMMSYVTTRGREGEETHLCGKLFLPTGFQKLGNRLEDWLSCTKKENKHKHK